MMNNGLMNTHPTGHKAQANLTRSKQRSFITEEPTRAAFNRRFALYKAGFTQRDLAADLQISPEMVSMAINNRCSSRTVATRLAELTGLSLKTLWPCGKYQEHAQ